MQKPCHVIKTWKKTKEKKEKYNPKFPIIVFSLAPAPTMLYFPKKNLALHPKNTTQSIQIQLS